MKKICIFLLVLAVFVPACSSGATQTVAPTVSSSTSSSGLFQIVKADGSTFDVTLDSLKKLPLANVTVDGKIQEGPKLMDVLNLAGVTDFSEVTLTGSASPVTLTRTQVDDNTILDFNNHGTLKLATTYVPMPQWTKDISRITVK
jgi:hypothetical protein